MFISKTAIKRPVTTWVLIIVLVLMGILAYKKLPLNVMPDVAMPIITVQVIYPGAGPEEIETNITKKIEDEVSTISNIDYVKSYVMRNVNMTVCQFKMDKDIDIANQEIKDKIDAIANQFPSDAEKAVVMKFDINNKPVVNLSFISSLKRRDAYDYVDKKLKDRFASINGVANVELSGGQEREIHIVLNKNDLKKYMLSPLQVIGFITQNNLSVPGGNIDKSGTEYSVRVNGEFETLDEIRNIKIPTSAGFKKLGDIATIEDSQAKNESIVRYSNLTKKVKNKGNLSVISIAIKKQSNANTVTVAKLIKEITKEINTSLPIGTSLEIAKDDSKFVKDSVDDTLSSIYLGILFTAIVLYLFLHSFKTTFIVALSMPIVLIATFMLMSGSGFSLNVMSLMALSVSVGTLVTNSVVILENIDRYMRMGMDRVKASDKGTAEIAVAVIASTLTNVVVFIPIASMESMVGQFFKEFGLTVTYIMLFSILISFTVTPMLSSRLLSKKQKIGAFGRWFDSLFEKINSIYAKTLGFIVKNPLNRIGIPLLAIALLIFSVIYIGPKLGGEFIPFVDDGDMEISIEMPSFYQIDKTSKVFQSIETILNSHKEVKTISTSIGESGITKGVNIGKITVKLKKVRSMSTNDFVGILTNELANIPDGRIKVSAISSMQKGGGDASPVQIEVSGKDQSIIENLTNKVYKIVLNTQGTINTDTDIRVGKPEITIIPNRKKIADYNTSVYNLAMTVRAFVEGIKASKFKESGNEYDIKIILDKVDKNDIEKITMLPLLTPKGNIKIGELASIKYLSSPMMITRMDKSRMQRVTADVIGRTGGNVVSDIENAIKKEIEIPSGYTIKAAGDAKLMAESNKDFANAFILAISLTFLLIVAILESWIQSILIMFTIPLSFIGVFWSLFVTGQSLNIFSMMAGVMLIGIVVNNAIIILDYANQLRKEGFDKAAAILEACPTKLKAIIMSTAASMLGMLPLALGLGSGAELRQGMGIVSIGGLLVGSLLTLFIIPALYVQFTRKNKTTENEA